ncbi:MAG: TonB-dependent receptor plug domain-containing protein [Gemmatimonadetes bacterium]|nr:TonB-dependent receptor plug domain-containing protein [Gemmatimonadota bacterium]
MSHPASRRFGRIAATLIAGVVATAGCATPNSPGASDDGRADEVRIGYGSQDRGKVTGAVVSVRAADLGREVTSFEDLVQGLAGVTVRRLASGGISLRIRGSSSFSGDAEPLYVINGVPMRAGPGQALMGVNPRNITRIDVLKDAGATAIYGSRGANGVVLIFTARRDLDPLS